MMLGNDDGLGRPTKGLRRKVVEQKGFEGPWTRNAAARMSLAFFTYSETRQLGA